MCGRFNLIDSPAVDLLLKELGVSTGVPRFSRDCAPCTTISLVRMGDQGAQLQDALWHLYLQPTATGFKPHPQYWSINTNYLQLPKKIEFKTHRCLIPATAFVESQEGKNPHLLSFEQTPFCFGGLYKTWTHASTGAQVTSASIITLAGHPKLAQIHRKSLPLMFNADQIDAMLEWMDPALTDPKPLEKYLISRLRKPLIATPVDKSSSKNPIGSDLIIEPDSAEA